jgi:hypothetical protein
MYTVLSVVVSDAMQGYTVVYHPISAIQGSEERGGDHILEYCTI